ncbi:MAG: NADH dehydrogenase [uncultured bacterium]|nr:MAG: NADH dehydrogenase [uncultured bacterium]
MSLIISTLLQVVLVLLIAPFVSGLVRFTKARLQGRRGASPFLPYVTFATLLRKEMVMPSAASWIFRAVPFVVLATSIALAFMLPLMFKGGSFAYLSDFLIIAGVLVTGSIFLVLGGLEPGSAFGGMGSSREMTIAALLEPTIIMIFAGMSFATGSSTIDGMLAAPIVFSQPHLLLLVIALILVALGENARYPLDNPATHLELTMVHEAMILEYSGPYLAMLEYASAIKLTVFALLISSFLFPNTLVMAAGFGIGALALGIVFAVIKVVVVALLLALIESTIVKMRFYRLSEYFSIAFFVALFGMAIALISSFSIIALEYHNLFATLAVIFVVLLFGRVRLKAMVRYYAFSSLAIAGIAMGMSRLLPEDERMHLWIFAIVTIAIKSIGVPFVIRMMGGAKKSLTNLPSFLRPGSSYILAVIVLAITFFTLKNTPIVELAELSSLLYASVGLVVVGLLMMVVQRNIYSQIVGLLVIENGVTVFVLATVESLPLAIELGVFFVTVISAFILSMLSARIGKFHGSADTDELRKLTE